MRTLSARTWLIAVSVFIVAIAVLSAILGFSASSKAQESTPTPTAAATELIYSCPSGGCPTLSGNIDPNYYIEVPED